MADMDGFYMFAWAIEDQLGGWDVAELHNDLTDFRASVTHTIEQFRDSFFTNADTAEVRVYRNGQVSERFGLLPLVRFNAPGLGELRLSQGHDSPEKVGGFPLFDGPYREYDRNTAWKQVPDTDVTVTIDWPTLPRLADPRLPTDHHVLLNGGTGRYVVLTGAQLHQTRQQPRGLVPLVEATGTKLDWLPEFINEIQTSEPCPDRRWSEIFLELDDIELFGYGNNLLDYSHAG